MGTQGTTSSSGRGDTSPANVVLSMTPMQAKALATLIGRSARHGSGLDAIRIALIRGASEVSSREPSSAASVLAETKAFVAGAQVDIAAARALPGVESAAVALTLPYERPLNDGFRILDGDDRSMHGTEAVYVTPGYFETMRIPVLRGRGFLDSDTPASAPVVVVSASFAARYFHGKEALGHHLSSGEIVGVVGDVQQHTGLYSNHGPISVEPTLYSPASQTSDGAMQLIHTWFSPKWVIRAGGPTGSLATQIQRAVASVDSQLPIASFQTIDDLQAHITASQRYRAALFSIFAGLALLLAAVGIYGSISQSITERTHELGVRMALGASAQQTIASVMKPGILLALLGAGAGYLMSLASVRFLEHLLWGVRPADPIAFAAAVAILLLTAALASLAPALRILRLDPAQTLRNE